MPVKGEGGNGFFPMATQTVGRDSLIGQALGHYRIIQRIGSGGMGVVYRARDEHLDREVAIKVLPFGTLADDPSRRRFQLEALALSKLNHPNIATIHDFDTEQGLDFLVMEYIPGITLNERLAEGSLPEKQVISLGTQLAEGLSAAHDHGVVHRDLKPSNLRLTSDGRLKILDFGLAKMLVPAVASPVSETLSASSSIAGTLPYMAPEQLLGADIDTRTDIHAAGAVLYEMATGQRPFAGVERPQLISAIVSRPPKRPTAINPRLCPELERIIGKCMEKDPDSRYQMAHELVIDLKHVARQDEPSTTFPRPGFRGPAISFFAALFVVFGVLVVVTTTRNGFAERAATVWHRVTSLPGFTVSGITEKDSILVTDFSNRTGDPVFDRTLRKAVILDLDQSPYLNVVSDRKVAEALKRMGRDPGERITPELGNDLCQRNGIKAQLVDCNS